MMLQHNGVFLHGADALSHQLNQRMDFHKSLDFNRSCNFDPLNNKPPNQFQNLTLHSCHRCGSSLGPSCMCRKW